MSEPWRDQTVVPRSLSSLRNERISHDMNIPWTQLLVVIVLAVACGSQNEARAAEPQFERRLQQIRELRKGDEVDWDAFEKKVAELQRDFPAEEAAYDPSLSLINHFQPLDPVKARKLAQGLRDSQAPEAFRIRAQGVIRRMDLMGNLVDLKFTAVDGREVDLKALRGKVVLIDFWATWCQPCVRDLPKVKQAYEKFRTAGFEIVGVSCDQNRNALQRFVRVNDIAWPNYFDGQRQADNRIAREFGVIGVPHMMLLDREGRLRFDNVKADAADFEAKIERLLKETSAPLNPQAM